MIEFDNGPVVLGGLCLVALSFPFFYSFFVDRNKKD